MQKPGDTRNEAPRNSEGLRPRWEEKAACRGYVTDYFDPWDANPTDATVNPVAAALCAHCPVQRECLLAGFESDRLNGGAAFSVWGGVAPKHRRAMIRLRYRVGCPVCKGQLIISPEGEEWQACATCGVTWRCRKRPVYGLNEDIHDDHASGTSGTGSG